METEIIGLWGYDEYNPIEWVEIPTQFKAEILEYLDDSAIGTLKPRGEIHTTPIVTYLQRELDSLLRQMLPYEIGREKFGSLAEAGDWEGWKKIARREIYRKVMNGAPYYKVIPDPNPPFKSSCTMHTITTDEIIPPKEIFEYRWQEYEKKLDAKAIEYTAAYGLWKLLGGKDETN